MIASVIRHVVLHWQSADNIHCHMITGWWKTSFLKQHYCTVFGQPDSIRLEKASLLNSSPNTSYLLGHKLDFDTSLGFRTPFAFQKCGRRHGIEPLIWQKVILFISTVTYGDGGGGEMGGKGGCFASLLSSLSLFSQSSIALPHWINLAVAKARC